MKNYITEKMTVRDVVVKYPETRTILEKYGIDYCCGGIHSLEIAAHEKGVGLEKLIQSLNDVIAAPPPEEPPVKDWTIASLTEFVDYIEEHHHTFMKAQLPLLRNLLSTVQHGHAARHGEMLKEVSDIYDSLQWEIEQHLMKEERILFPYIRQIEAFIQGRQEEPVIHCGTIQNPIRQMEHEHEKAGDALEKMREITTNYTLPDDACNSFRALYDGLKAVEDDLHEHIHLENNILFPRAIEMECASGKV